MTERDENEAGWALPDEPAREPVPAAAPPPQPPPPTPPPSAAWQTTAAPGVAGSPARPAASGTPSAPGRRRRAWLVVLVAVLGAITLVAVAGTVLFVDRTLPPYNGAHDFLDDIVHGRVSSAESRLCALDRDDPENALVLVTRNFTGGKTVSVNVLGVDRSGDEATVKYAISPRNGGADRTYKLPVRYEGGQWRACPSAA